MKVYLFIVGVLLFVGTAFSSTTYRGIGRSAYLRGETGVPVSIDYDSLWFFGEPVLSQVTAFSDSTFFFIDKTGGIGTQQGVPFPLTPGLQYQQITVLKDDADSIVYIVKWNGSHEEKDNNVPPGDPHRFYTVYESYFAIAKLSKATASVAVMNQEPITVEIYPNPTAGKLRIASTISKPGTIRIVDQLGNTALEQQSGDLHDEIVNVSMLSTGSYLVSIQTTQGKVAKRFIKY